jgi:beta-glucosidase/6-phospho-beta-glucosidase/beta-galactosidase
VLPTGEGAINAAGLDHYSKMVDAMLAKGITPYATLFHWDLPQALQDKGGWTNRDTALRFADYARAVVERLGDRLKHFITLNEAAVHTVFGHVLGEHAPGLKDITLLGPVTHHMNLGQGLAIQALRAARERPEHRHDHGPAALPAGGRRVLESPGLGRSGRPVEPRLAGSRCSRAPIPRRWSRS